MTELKPCPFCGSEEIEICVNYDKWEKKDCYFGCCADCDSSTGSYYARIQAIEAWNRRSDDK